MLRYSCYLLMMLVSVACEYSPAGEFEKLIDPEVAPESLKLLHIDLMTVPENDTIRLGTSTSFNYHIQTGSLQFYGVEVLLDGKYHTSSQEARGDFLLDPYYLSTGFHALKLISKSNTGTGSLADKVGAEGIVFSRSWVVVVDNDPPHAIDVSAVTRRDGGLRVDWDKYSRVNFKQYIVYKKDQHGYTTPIANLYNQDLPYYYDPEYVGGAYTYSVAVKTNREENSPQGKAIMYTDSFPAIHSIELTAEDKIRVSWSKSRYPANLQAYQIYYHSWQPIHIKQDVNDTTQIIDKPIFGKPVSIRLGTLGNGQHSNIVAQSSKRFQYGQPFGRFDHIVYCKAMQRLYYTAGDTLFMADEVSGQTLAHTVLPADHYFLKLQMDASGKYLLMHTYTKSIYLNVETLDIVREIPYEVLSGGRATISSVSVSSQGILAVFANMSQQEGRFILYDLKSNQILSSQVTPFLGSGMVSTFSSDGLYLFQQHGAKLYTLSETGEILSSRSLSEAGQVYADIGYFSPDGRLLFLIDKDNYNEGKISAYRTNDLQLENQFTMNGIIHPFMDPMSGYLYGSKSGGNSSRYLFIYDYNTNSYLKEIQVIEDSYTYPYVRLLNNHLYSPAGVRLALRLP